MAKQTSTSEPPLHWLEFAFVEEGKRFENWTFQGELARKGTRKRLSVAASARGPDETAQVQETLARCARWILANEPQVVAHLTRELEQEQGLKGCAEGSILDRIVLHRDEVNGEYFTAWFSSRRHTPIVFISTDDFHFIGEPELYE